MAGHVVRMEEGRSAFKIYKINPQERYLYKHPEVDGKTTLEWILKKWVSISLVDSAQDGDYWTIHVNAALIQEI